MDQSGSATSQNFQALEIIAFASRWGVALTGTCVRFVNEVGGQALVCGTPTAPFRTGQATIMASGSPVPGYLGRAAKL